MFDNKFLISLIGIAVAISLFANSSKAKKPTEAEIVENWGTNPSQQVKVERVVGVKGSNDFYSVPSNFQSMISPRMYSGSYPANIKYNIPDRKNLGVPMNPLGDRGGCDTVPMNPIIDHGGCDISEGFEEFEGYQSSPVPSGFEGYQSATPHDISSSKNYPDVTSVIPVGTMETNNGLGEVGEVVIYDRYIYANRNSRLRAQGDMIRGDLNIIPCQADWFRPSVQPHIDLQQGALNVIAGVQNTTAQQLANLVNYSSGGTMDTIGGVNMSSAYDQCFSSGYGDINVTSFP
jgi:hypothetical protein